MYTNEKSRVYCLHCENFKIKIISENDIPEEAYCVIKNATKNFLPIFVKILN